MKRFLILAGIAALAFSSCAKDEIKQVNKGHAIDFKVVQTKGDVTQYSKDLNEFYVTAFSYSDESAALYFQNVGFARVGEYFTSNPAYYWPVDGTNLIFFAYTPGANKTGATVEMDVDNLKIEDFAPSSDINNHVDLMTAMASGNKTNDETSGVDLQFNHQLARIAVKAIENNSAYSYSVKGVRLVNLISKGTFDFNEGWNLEGEKSTYTLEYDDNPLTVSSSYSTLMYNSHNDRDYNDAMVLPQPLTPWDPADDPGNEKKGAYISVKLQIKSTDSGDQVFPATAGAYDWVAIPVPKNLTLSKGTTYEFYLNFTNGAGYTTPENNIEADSAEKILGDDIMFTVKVNESETPSTQATLRKDLEGNWHAKKIEVCYEYDDDYEGSTREALVITDPAEVEDWFYGNGFYQFTVDNDYNITMTTPGGVTATGSFYVDNEGNIYIDSFYDGENYSIIPKVHEIDEENNICVTTIFQENFHKQGEHRRSFFYYDRN